MFRLLLPLVLLLSYLSPAAAQQTSGNGQIKGIVLDSASASAAPVGFATVALREPGKTEPMRVTYSADNGSFEFKNLPEKSYEVVIAFVGYKTKVVPVTGFPAGKPVVDLGKIQLSPMGQQLETVEITGEKLLIKQEIDKLTYEVEADPESQTLTALDMLRKVPLITVDGQDQIQLKGSGNYRVLVNGKSSSLFARDPSDVFKSMPASSIKRIEIITEPSAKYDAEGVGGIINIITVKQSVAGYNGSVSGGGGLPENYRLNAFGTVKAGKLGASVYFGGGSYTQPEAKNLFRRKNFLNEGSELRQDGTNSGQGQWNYLNAQLSFEFDSLNLLTGELGLNGSAHKSKLAQDVRLLSGEGALVQAYRRRHLSTEDWRSLDLALDYQKSFSGKPDRLLTFSYKRTQSNNEDDNDIFLEPQLNLVGFNARNNNVASTTEHTGQVDYVHPVGKHTLEAGLKTIVRLSDSDFYYGLINPETGNLEIDPSQSNLFDYRQDIYAAYTSVGLQKDKWGLKMGGRLEETRINADFSSSQTVARQEYLNLIPSVALSRKFRQMDAVKLSYNQRIERPGLWTLNPFIDRSDPRNIRYGNPDLRPVISHNLDLSYTGFIKTASVGGSVFQNFTRNSVQYYTVLGTDSISRSTYANIGRSRVAGLSVFGNVTLYKNLSVRANLSGRYNWISSNTEGFARRNKGLAANYSGGFTYKLAKTWKLSGNAGGSSSRVTLQGRSTGYLWHNVSVTKGFLADDKLSVIFTVNNPFQRTRKWGSEINDPEFYQLTENYFFNQSFNVSISYRFGKLKDSIATTKRGIKNDDVSGGGNSGGGQAK